MGSPVDGSAASRRDVLVQQLLQERRRRLQEKLAGQDSEQQPKVLPEPPANWRFHVQAGVPGTPRNGVPRLPDPSAVRSRSRSQSPRYATPTSRGRQQTDSRGGQQTDSFSTPIARRPIQPHTAESPRAVAGAGSSFHCVYVSEPIAVNTGAAAAVPRLGTFENSARGQANNSSSSSLGVDRLVARIPDSKELVTNRPGASTEVAAKVNEDTRVPGKIYNSSSLQGADSPFARRRPRPKSAPPVRTLDLSLSFVASQEPSVNFKARLQGWTSKFEALQQRRQVAREARETEEIQACTFRPSINNKSERYARRTRGASAEPLTQRLYQEGDRRIHFRTKAREILEVDEMCAHPFQPKINPRNSAEQRKPIYLRAGEIHQSRQDKIREAQVAGTAHLDTCFQPRISNKSERLAQRRRDRMYRSLSQGDPQGLRVVGPVENRLYAEAEILEQRRNARSVGEVTQAGPAVDAASKRICQSSVYFQGAQRDFLTRQQTFALARVRRREIRVQHAEATTCPFRPNISNRSRQINNMNPEMMETPEERIHRLAVKDIERRDQLKDALGQYHMRDYTFKPEVTSSNAQQVASKTDDGAASESASNFSVYERLYRDSAHRSRGSFEVQLEDPSFQPQKDPRNAKKYSHVKARYTADSSTTMQNINQELGKKAEHVAARRREQESAEGKECTFAPEINGPYQEQHAPVFVGGLNRFYELRDLATKQQREQQEREAKIFRPEASGKSCAGVTIPEPFDLSKGPRDQGGKLKETVDNAVELGSLANDSTSREIMHQLLSCAFPEQGLIDRGQRVGQPAC